MIMLTLNIYQFNFAHYEWACGQNILKRESYTLLVNFQVLVYLVHTLKVYICTLWRGSWCWPSSKSCYYIKATYKACSKYMSCVSRSKETTVATFGHWELTCSHVWLCGIYECTFTRWVLFKTINFMEAWVLIFHTTFTAKQHLFLSFYEI